MREILFRAKRKCDGKWEYGFPMRYDPTHKLADIFLQGIDVSFAVDINTIGQFTGLIDKNGTKIFEGDIVSYKGYDKGIVTFGEHKVECCNCCSYHRAIGFYVDRKQDTIYSNERTWDDFEVIGNIHDNPELLEVTNER